MYIFLVLSSFTVGKSCCRQTIAHKLYRCSEKLTQVTDVNWLVTLNTVYTYINIEQQLLAFVILDQLDQIKFVVEK